MEGVLLRFLIILACSYTTHGVETRVRLVNGRRPSEGRVEVFFNNVWGTVCDDGFSTNAALIVCHSLGFPGTNVVAKPNAAFGQGSGRIQLDDVICTGQETTIFNCRHQAWGTSNCHHSEDVGVDCNTAFVSGFPVRLAGGNTTREGRVEIQLQGRWGTVCDDDWDDVDAMVICRQLGFMGGPSVPINAAYFGQGTGDIWLDDVACTGNETGLGACPSKDFGHSDCDHSEDAGVICLSNPVPQQILQVRLVGGVSQYQGRIEVNFVGRWGTVCDDDFTVNTARVFCRMLGWSNGTILRGGNYGAPSGPIWLDDVGCRGTEGSILNCTVKPFGVNDCGHDEDVAIRCDPAQATDIQVRLVGGSTTNEGRVEVNFQGHWGTVCDDLWTASDAAVVCRMLHLSTDGAVAITKHGFGMGTGPIHLDDVRCVGTENSLADCVHSPWDHTNCDHSEDAGVYCETAGMVANNVTVRLLGGPDTHSGRVEILYNNTWGTICDDNFGPLDAKVVCIMLGFSGDGAHVFNNAHFGIGHGPILLDDVDCAGTESSIALCGHRGWGRNNCGHSEDVGVVCMGGPTVSPLQVRLVGGSTTSEGRVEVFHGGQWGTVCDDRWDAKAAKVVCRMLGLQWQTAQARRTAYFGQGAGTILLDEVRCTGSESSLDQCVHNVWGTNDCHHNEDAGVVCGNMLSTRARLVGGSDTTRGRVELFVNNTWGTICDDGFGGEEAKVVCRMLGFHQPGAIAISEARFGQGTGPILLDDLACLGTETSILQCASKGFGQSDCTHSEDAGVQCNTATVRWRLAGTGSTRMSGRLELFVAGQWGTVCDDSFDNRTAAVACEMLRQPSLGAVAIPHGGFGPGNGTIFLDDVHCTGNETTLLDCQHSAFGTSNCQHREDVGIRCGPGPLTSSGVRLVDGNTTQEGRLEVSYNGIWGTVCDDGFTDIDASVACRWLGVDFILAKAAPIAHYGQGSGTIILDDVGCRGNESSLFDCRHRTAGTSDCQHSEDVGVQCFTAADLNSDMVRLVNGSSPQSGRVEIRHNNEWGTICDDQFGTVDANVVCRQLGFPSANGVPVHGAYFGMGTGRVLLNNVQCTGTEPRLSYCRHNLWGVSNCNHGDDAGVICLSHGFVNATVLVRLRGGLTVSQGRVEVLYNGMWGSVCQDGFNGNGASVICRMLGYSRGGRVLARRSVGGGRGPIWLDDVRCLGTESSIAECRLKEWGVNNCNHARDLGVFCIPDATYNFTARLVHGPSPMEGRVEVFYNRQWSTVCDDNWSNADAAVVCQMLGFGTDGAHAFGNAKYGQGTGTILLDDVQCLGTESNLAQCHSAELGHHNCHHNEDAGVKCNPAGQVVTSTQIRLVNGPNPHSGRVEIFHSNVWGTICDDAWTAVDAQVICRMLGYPTTGAIARSSAFFRPGTGQIWLDDVHCTGIETNIALCQHRPWGTHNCGHGEDAGVICSANVTVPTHLPIRLMGGTTRYQGRVEIFYNNTWGTICDDSFGTAEAQVICRQLGFNTAGAIPKVRAFFGAGRGPITLDEMRCVGTEVALDVCAHNPFGNHNCQHGEDAGVICAGSSPTPTQVRLVGANSPSQGRVEIQINGTWGTICDDLFSAVDAGVICSMLGFQRMGALARPQAAFGRGSGPIYLDDVRCTGTETSILQCAAKPIRRHNCQHNEDVGVICIAAGINVRLVGGSTRFQGRVEINYNNTWGTVCDDNFDSRDAKVVCRMLGFPTAGAAMLPRRTQGRGPIWLDDLACLGVETSLLQCRSPGLGIHNCQHTEDVGVICSATAITTRRVTPHHTTPRPTPDPLQVFVRLVGGKSAFEGRVEIWNSGQFGTVCDDFWTGNDSNVICGMLGYSRTGSAAKITAFFGQGTGQIWLDDVKCRGRESNIVACPSSAWGVTDCQHTEDAGVICSSGIRPNNFILMTDSNNRAIYRMDMTTFSYVQIPQDSHRNPVAIDYDPLESRIYWTDVGTRQIRSSYLDGTSARTLMQLDSRAVPDGLAVDPLSRNVYYTDSGNNAIVVMTLDGFTHRTIISGTGVDRPRAIALYPQKGLLFWTDWGSAPTIERSNMDGSSRESIIATGLKWPNGIAIDYAGNQLYWCDGGTFKIETSDFNGQHRRVLLQDQHANFYGIVVVNDNLVYTDWNTHTVMRIGKANGQGKTTIGPGGFGRLNGVVYHKDRYGITGTNACSVGRGGCSHICFPTTGGSTTCACPDGLTLQPSRLSCSRDVPCNHLTEPPFGSISPNNCTTGRSPVGTVCIVSCLPGFNLIGQTKIICHGNGQWTNNGNLLTCTDTQPPQLTCPKLISATASKGATAASVTWTMPKVTDNGGGTVQITSSLQSPTSLQEGQYTVFVTASDSSGLTSSCSFNVIVTVKRCPKLNLPANAYLATPFCQTHYGSSCPVRCGSGYTQMGKQTVTCDQGQDDVFQWTTSSVTCTPVTCPALSTPSNGRLFGCRTPYPMGSVCTQACFNGFLQTGGTASRKCLRDGSWTGVPLVCGKNPSCPSLDAPTNGILSCQAPFSVGTVCTQSCVPGFTQTAGNPVRQCLTGGAWSGKALVCTKPGTCTALPTPANGKLFGCVAPYTVGSICSQSCKTGFKQNGGTFTRHCQPDNSWSGTAVTCSKPPSCPDLPVPGNGTTNDCPASPPIGTFCTQSCLQGFLQTGGTAERQCVDADKWSGDVIVCQPESDVDRRPHTEHQTGPGPNGYKGGNTAAVAVLAILVALLILAAVGIGGMFLYRRRTSFQPVKVASGSSRTYELRPTDTYDDRTMFNSGLGINNPMYGDGDGL